MMTGGWLTRGCNGTESLFYALQQAGRPTFLLRAAEQATGDSIFHRPPSLIHLTLAVSVCICGFSEIYDSLLLGCMNKNLSAQEILLASKCMIYPQKPV